MKKFIISAFLVVSLFAVSVAPAFAVVGVDDAAAIATIAVAVKQEYDKFVNGLVSSSTFQSELANYKRCWGTPSATSATCTISYEALCELCISINQTNLQSCRLYYNSSLGGYVIRAQGPYFTYTSSGAYREIWDNTYSTLRNSDAQYYVAPYNTDSLLNQIENNTDGIEGYIDQIEGRLARTVGSTIYTIADIGYNQWQLLKDLQPSIESTANRLVMTTSDGVKHTAAESAYWAYSTLRDISPNIESAANRLIMTTSDGTKHSVAESAYWTYSTLQDIEPHISRIESRLLKTEQNGNQYTVAELGYNIWSRMGDLISAVNNKTISFDASGIRLSVDSNSFNLWNNEAYCIGYRTDASGANYGTLTIPYDTATAILERLNTDYVGQSVTVLNRDGSTSTKNVRSATLLDDGAIRVFLTNGYTYYLCDNTNVLYMADMTGNLDYQVSRIVNAFSGNVGDISVVTNAYDDTAVVSALNSVLDSLTVIGNNQRDYTYQGFNTLFDPFMEQLVSQNDSIIQSINNLDVSGGTFISSADPYTRKIYNVLYDGVNGTGAGLVDIATSQMGVNEGRPYYTWYGFNNHVEWCACFVSWCADQCGYLDDIIPKFAVVVDGVEWFKSHNLWLDGAGSHVVHHASTSSHITPVRITDNSHQYVTIYVDIAEDGTLTASGAGKNGGQFYNPEIEPSVADFTGNQTVTVYWGGSSAGRRNDSKQVNLVYNVVAGSDGGITVDDFDAGTPSPGDIIFFDWDADRNPDHVGIVADCTDGVVTTVEGNTGDSPGVVSSRSIAVDSPLIYGYGTPDYPAGGSSIYSVLVGIYNKIGNAPVSVSAVSSYDDTVLIAKLTDIEDTLSKLGDNASDKITDIDIAVDRNSHDIFYVTDDDGNDKSIVDLSGDSIKVVGKLMDFLYAVMFKDALDGAGDSIDGLYDFYLDNSEGVDVWAS